MSHIASYTVGIVNPNMGLLNGAVTMTAEEEKGTVETDGEVSEFAGRQRQKVSLLIKTPDLKRGVGINVATNGELTFIGDPYGMHQRWNKIKDRVVQNYVVLASRALGAEMGWSQETQEQGQNVQVRLRVAA